jgi:hypothetical protein
VYSKKCHYQSGRPDLNRRPLDPQEVGLAVLTGQWGSGDLVLRVPTCWLSGHMHSVWSQSGPKRSPGGPAVDPRIKRQAQPRPESSESVRPFGLSRHLLARWSAAVRFRTSALLLALLLAAIQMSAFRRSRAAREGELRSSARS